MCGITGVYYFEKSRQVDKSILTSMTKVISHRGPDGSGIYTNENIGLGHRRLSIIDLSTGDQPMYNEDKSIVLVFNGEIYNYPELRSQLQTLGHRFVTESDTEVIIKAYEQWGFECQNKFNGMWAFALWDNKKQFLFISRDRLGEKPLNYCIHDNTLIFGSEIKCITSYGVPKIPDYDLLEIYLGLGYVPAPFTFYKDIKKLEAGHYILVKNNKVQVQKYWDLPDIDESDMNHNSQEVYKEFEQLFNDSVRIRMRSDVPYGAFLSGGIDSAAIVSLMSKYSDLPVRTFTMGFAEPKFDERSLAKLVSDKFNTKHYEREIQKESLSESLNKVIYFYDEPFGDPAAIPTGYISAYARKKVKMVLSGDGGDEVLSGYRSFRGEKLVGQLKSIPKFIKHPVTSSINYLSLMLSGSFRYSANRIHGILKNADLPFEERMIKRTEYLGNNSSSSLLANKGNSSISSNEYYHDLLSKCRFKDPFYQLNYCLLKSSLPDQMLVKVDKMSMANSLEVRVPFLDYRLVEFLYTTSKKIKLPSYTTKVIMRNTIGKVLPEPILNSPKRGFNVPLREWFKDESFNILLAELTKSDIGLNNQIIKNIVEANSTGKADYGNFIWRLLVYKGCVDS